MPGTKIPSASFIAFAVGAAVGILALGSWLVGGGHGYPGAEVVVSAPSPEGLLVTPAQSPFVERGGLRPGGAAASGSVLVRNVADRRLAVRVGAAPVSGALEPLQLEIAAGRRILARGPLSALGRPGGTSVVLAPGEMRRIRARAWLGAAADGWEARSVEVGLRFDVRALEGS